MVDSLRHKALESGFESRVQVNQRMLIDKMLSRYSSEFVVCRELIQNADDAKANFFHFQIIENDQRKFIEEIRAINDGLVFTETDWKRVAAIAEGNENVESVGQFGVGFFSVFSFCEEPIIASGNEYLTFVWRDDQTLTTFRHVLPTEQRSNLTSIILKIRPNFLLNEKTEIDFNFQGKTENKSSTIDEQNSPTIHLNQLKNYFAKVLSFTKHLNELLIKINQQIIFKVKKTRKILPMKNPEFKLNSIHKLFLMNRFTEHEQIFTIENGPSIKLNQISVEAQLNIDEIYHQNIQRILKKKLPEKIQIQFLYGFDDKKTSRKSTKKNDLASRILQSLVPLRGGEPAGLIFIGLGTHQTTGVGMHVYSHLIPTIERENLDLQDPYISKWNREILFSVGQILRVFYDEKIPKIDDFFSFFSIFSFQRSVPNSQIGATIVDGFFSSKKILVVPVKNSPEDVEFSLVPSNKAFLTSSKFLNSFLTLPLIPHELNENEFFQSLKERNLIVEVNDEIVESTIVTNVLLDDQFVALLHWLLKSRRNEKIFFKKILSIVRFREKNDSTIINFDKLKFYSEFNLPNSIRLPSNVLPSTVGSQLSREQLEKQLNLSSWNFKDFLHFYLLKNQQNLFTEEKSSSILLEIISKYSGQMTKNDFNKMKTILSSLNCIPTNNGMKLPNESYIPSMIVTSDVPIINLPTISEEFLKRLGCRTIDVQSFVQSGSSSNETNHRENIHLFIEHLMEERESMTEGDFAALKRSEFLPGITLDADRNKQRKYAPEQLHFPWLAKKLRWNSLPIIDSLDLDRNSKEYNFLKSIGVREAPELGQLIERIIEEFDSTSLENEISLSLKFFAENFQQEYSKQWKTLKIKRPFIPSISPDNIRVLSTVDEIFKMKSPLFPTLNPQVANLFEENSCLTLLGIKTNPTLTVAFDVLISRKEKFLTVESAPEIFSYFNDLDGLSRPFIERISKFNFIPVEGKNELFRVNQIFIKPNSNSTSIENSKIFVESSDDDEDEEIRRTQQTGRRRAGKRSAKIHRQVKSKKSKNLDTNSSIVQDEIDLTGLIDYVDFGSVGNSFLLAIGVTNYPTAKILAELLIDRQNQFFFQSIGEDLKRKILAYTTCLRRLASSIDELQLPTLVKRLKNEPWCLGFQLSDDGSQRLFRIVRPSEIYLDDDHQCAIDLRPLLSPEESEITKLYEKFGAKWLSESVTRNLVHKGRKATSDRGEKLRNLIQQRLDMLFVNNRGEKINNLDEKRLELLRSHLSVYEVDAIRCQLTFQKETINLDATNSSSCAIEHDKTNVYLYFQKQIRTFDFIDIATELSRFVFKKPLDNVVHSISDKLASPLETLKRRGVPVDRLLSHKKRESIQTESTNNSTHQRCESMEFSQIENNVRVKDFSRNLTRSEEKILSNIRKGRTFTQNKFIQDEHFQDEVDHSCEAVPAANMTRHKERFHSLPLYIEHNVRINDQMIDQAKQLAWLLVGLAKNVFQIPVETFHLYRDIDGARLAFNDRRALFFNLRYYEQVFAKDLQPHLKSSSELIAKLDSFHSLVNFYFLTICHELAHNFETAHNANFVNHLETIAVKFLTAKDYFVQNFSFENYSITSN